MYIHHQCKPRVQNSRCANTCEYRKICIQRKIDYTNLSKKLSHIDPKRNGKYTLIVYRHKDRLNVCLIEFRQMSLQKNDQCKKNK